DSRSFWFPSDPTSFSIRNGSQSHPLHKASDTVLAGKQAAFAQRYSDPGTAISTLEFFVHLQNGFLENFLVDGSLTFSAFLPVIIPLGADSKHFTHEPDGIDFYVALNKPILGYSGSFKNA
ncbi:hypothetical protein, partial [Brevibacillus sp. SYP-B805]|uniref:hypothetical protein n=1 Tax=Brevibacillus sp. SYP-B805 TaxID=1578199 RepID=UPI001F49B1D6